MVPGLCESVKLKWSGDVDLNDGKLDSNYQQYRAKLNMISSIGIGSRRPLVNNDLSTCYQQLIQDKDFLVKGKSIFVIS